MACEHLRQVRLLGLARGSLSRQLLRQLGVIRLQLAAVLGQLLLQRLALLYYALGLINRSLSLILTSGHLV